MAEYYVNGNGDRVLIPNDVVSATADRSLVAEFVAASPSGQPAIVSRAAGLMATSHAEAAALQKQLADKLAAQLGLSAPTPSTEEE